MNEQSVLSPETLQGLNTWLGRRMEAGELLTAEPVAKLSATLSRHDPAPQDGDPLPPLWHWLYFHIVADGDDLGRDGLPVRGSLLPPVPLPMRMWAGSRFKFLKALPIGSPARRISRVEAITPKQGRSGPLVFVDLRHDVVGRDGVAIEETQSIVFRGPGGDAGTGNQQAPVPEGEWRRVVTADPVVLFRYSALTFNGHRIHYDRPYVTEVEGYPGLVVHGPLLATLMLDLVRRHAPDAWVETFDFRAQAPVFGGQPFTVNGTPTEDVTGAELWVADHAGTLAMKGAVTFRRPK